MNLIKQLKPVITGGSDAEYRKPKGIAFVPAHPDLVVVTADDNVQVYDSEKGALMAEIGRGWCHGKSQGEFHNPVGVVVTADSKYIIVADKSNNRLQKLTLSVNDGKVHLAFNAYIGRQFTDYGFEKDSQDEEELVEDPSGLALRGQTNNQTVLVVEEKRHQVSEWSLNGDRVRIIGKQVLKFPTDVTTISTTDHIAVTDKTAHCVIIFDGHNGNTLKKVGGYGIVFNGTFVRPCSIATNPYNQLLVLDEATTRLQVFDDKGTYMHTFKNSEFDRLEKNESKRLACRSDGRLAITIEEEEDVMFFENSKDDKTAKSSSVANENDEFSTRTGHFVENPDSIVRTTSTSAETSQ